MAQRIVLELKTKIEEWYQKRCTTQPALAPPSNIAEEARSILANLGYTNTEINLALLESKKAQIDEDVETLVRNAPCRLRAILSTEFAVVERRQSRDYRLVDQLGDVVIRGRMQLQREVAQFAA